MNCKKFFGAASVLVLLSVGEPHLILAQDANAAKPPVPAAPAQVEQGHSYRGDFSLIEIQNGKKVDTRQYSLTFGTNGRGHISIGTRVPTTTKTDGTVSYLDANTTIDASIGERAHDTVLDVNCNVTSVVPGLFPGQDPASPPILRILTISSVSMLVVGKQIVVGVADDPNSKAQFELDATITETK